MKSRVLVSVAVLLFCLPIRANRSDALELITIQIDTLQTCIGRLQGLVLGSQIQVGMTTEQVDHLLGANAFHLDNGVLVGSSEYWTRRYYKYGIIVSFHQDNRRVLRVESVHFFP
jgi:hypothetical protein